MGGEEVDRCEVWESILNGEEDHGQRHGGEKATCGLSVTSTQGSSWRRGEEGMMGLRVQVSEYRVRNLDFHQQAVQSYYNCCYYSGKRVNIF